MLAVGVAEKDSVTFFEGTNAYRSFLRISAVMEQEFFALGDEDSSLYAEHATKIERLHHYDASEEVELTWQMKFLDASPDSACIDDVLVDLFKEGLSPEGCWVRITGLEEHNLAQRARSGFWLLSRGKTLLFCSAESGQAILLLLCIPGITVIYE